jgi:hypothetical protein
VRPKDGWAERRHAVFRSNKAQSRKLYPIIDIGSRFHSDPNPTRVFTEGGSQGNPLGELRVSGPSIAGFGRLNGGAGTGSISVGEMPSQEACP